MKSDAACQSIELLSQRVLAASSQEDLNSIYSGFCSFIDSQLITKSGTKKPRKHKPWWDKSLSLLRKVAKKARRDWLLNKSDKPKKELYMKSQKAFDREVCRMKGKYYRAQQYSLLDSIHCI